MSDRVALAFSGGLDTSFCVPWLRERGYEVITLFVDTGGGAEQASAIADRARELGAIDHVHDDAGAELWSTIVEPFVMAGACWQDQYPLLCSDRYVIVRRLVALAERIGAVAVAHGCTAMGNDQVRFDQSLACLTDLPVIAPIREIQGSTDTPRAYEIEMLRRWGFDVDEQQRRYTINENLLGVTISGSEIDAFQPPAEDARVRTAPRSAWPAEPCRASSGGREVVACALDGVAVDGPDLLAELDGRFGAYGVGRALYTGDTVIGLKGRILFEAPGLTALLTAHRALEETVLSRAQNGCKPLIARAWAELVYGGAFYEPLREDLEAFLRSSQRQVTGRVTLESTGGTCMAVAVESPAMLGREGLSYAQAADWSAADAEGFIRLHGLSSALACEARRRTTAAAI